MTFTEWFLCFLHAKTFQLMHFFAYLCVGACVVTCWRTHHVVSSALLLVCPCVIASAGVPMAWGGCGVPAHPRPVPANQVLMCGGNRRRAAWQMAGWPGKPAPFSGFSSRQMTGIYFITLKTGEGHARTHKHTLSPSVWVVNESLSDFLLFCHLFPHLWALKLSIAVGRNLKNVFIWSRFPEFKHRKHTHTHTNTHTSIWGSNQPCNSDVRANLSGRKCFLMKSFINFNTTCQLTWCMDRLLIHISNRVLLRNTAGVVPCSTLECLCGYGCQRRSERERNATGVSVTLLIFRYRDFITAPCRAASQRSETES